MNGKTVKFIRFLLGIKQIDLARKVNVDQSLIAKVETGVVPVSAALTQKLLTTFYDEGITPYDIQSIQQLLNQRNN